MSRADSPRLRIAAIELGERPVRLRLPFRFGVVTVREASQAFARARVVAGGREAWGAAAELMIPKWFDKRPALSNAENLAQLRRSLATARDAYLSGGEATAFEHARAVAPPAGAEGGLVSGYGPALIDRAVMDGLCRALELPVLQALRENRFGIAFEPALDADGFLAGLAPAARMEARHTVGLADALADAELDPAERVDDGLPESLDAAIARYGLSAFKVKVCGDTPADLARLRAVAGRLDRLTHPYRVTLDGNEQFRDVEAARELLEAVAAEPALERLRASLLYVEQPIHRDLALDCNVRPLARFAPVVIDESDADDEAFVRARECGYAGVSTKTCKGVYRSLRNAARCAAWNAEGPASPFFVTAEDLTCQAGLAVQQDLWLAALLGCTHAERNGHHYATGLHGAADAERDAFAAAHPDLYRRHEGGLRLRIEKGRIALASLDCVGFASAALPDFEGMTPVEP